MTTDTPTNTRICGVLGIEEEEQVQVVCDLPPFHPEDQHHARIPSVYPDIDDIGEHWWKVGPFHRIPTHLHGDDNEPGLVDLMNTTERSRWTEITERLAAQINDREKAFALISEAEFEITEDAEVTRLRQALHQAIAAAQDSATEALRTLRSLDERDSAYENSERGDTWAFLNDARRALAAAQALKPTNADGE